MFDSLFLNIIVYIFINILISFAGYKVSRKIFKLNRTESIVGAFVLSIGLIIGIELLLGALIAKLTAVNLFVAIIVVAFIGIWITFERKDYQNFGLKKVIQNIRTSVPKPDLLLAIISGAFLLTVLNILLHIILYPSTSWDDYHYHLGFVNDVIQTGMLRDFPYTHVYTITFPHNIELINLWHAIFLKSDSFVEITNLSFLIVATIVIYLFSRRFGVSKKWSLIAGFLIFFIPINVVLTKTTKVDLDIAVLFITSIYFLLKLNINQTWKENAFLILPAICIGIIFGSKSSSALYVGILTLLAVVIVLIQNKWKIKPSIKPVLKIGILIGISCLMFGAYWFIRSWVWYDNPIAPVEVDKFGIYFPGAWRDLDFADGLPQIENRNFLQRLLYVWREKESWFGVFYQPDTKINGFGSLWYILLLPSLLLTYIISIVKKQRDLFLTLSAVILCFLLIPGNWVLHYSMVITFVGTIAFGYFADNFIKTKVIKFLTSLLLVALAGLNMALASNLGVFDYQETLNRLSPDENEIYSTSQRFPQSNKLINTVMDKGDIVVVGSQIFFPYSLVKDGFQTSTVLIPFKSESEWIDSVQKLNPRFLMVMPETSEYTALRNNTDLFELVLIEPDGPHYLFAYKNNEKNKYIAKEEILSKDYPDLDAALPEIKTVNAYSSYKIVKIDFEYQPTSVNFKEPILFVHLIYPNGEFLNLDQAITDKDLSDGFSEDVNLPIQRNIDYKVEFGLLDVGNGMNYYPGDTLIFKK